MTRAWWNASVIWVRQLPQRSAVMRSVLDRDMFTLYADDWFEVVPTGTISPRNQEHSKWLT
jgi:hypothetical protein